MLKNDYSLAKIGLDTAENESSKVWTCLIAASPTQSIAYVHLLRHVPPPQRDLHRKEGRLGLQDQPIAPGLFKFMSATPGGGGYFCRLPACQKQQIFCKSCRIFLKIHLKTK